MRDVIRCIFGWARRVWENVCWLAGSVAVLALLLVLLPLLPFLRTYDDIRRMYEDD